MPLELLPLEEADLRAYYDIIWESTKDDDFTRAFWPNGYPVATRDWSVAQTTDEMRTEKETHKFMKVVDTDLPADDPYGQVVSIAKWHIYPRDRTDEELAEEERKKKEMGMPPGANADFLTDFFSGAGQSRKSIIGNKAHVYLSMLFTRPDGFRRGAGSMHLKWGLGVADQLGVPAYLEASPMGRPLYERNGFEFVQPVPVDNKKWGFADDFIVACLLRPATEVK